MNPPVLEIKLRPAINGNALVRERLVQDLNENSSKRLILMVSYSGTGKTTLASQFVQTRSMNSIWYDLDPYDQDPAVFFHYLITALRKHYPAFCQQLDAAAFSSWDGWTRIIGELQDVIREHFFIVLDNYQCIYGAKPINQFLTYLLQHLPQTLHLVILTEQEPRFSLSRYRMAGDLYQLGPKDLAFTYEEAVPMIENACHIPLPETALKKIVQDTEGWALALVLFAQNINLKSSSRQYLSAGFREKYKEELQEYFLEEILKTLPRKVQDLLMSSALLPFISPNELDAFLGKDNSRVLLKCIARSNIPAYPLNGGTGAYRYHNLFRDFLLKKHRDQKSEQDIRSFHLKAAGALEKNHPAEAINHYLEAGHTDLAVRILEELGWYLLKQGRYETLKVLLNKISPELRPQNPALLYYTGRLLEIHGDLEEAHQYYHKAMEGLGENEGKAEAACKERLGILELKKDRFKNASQIFLHAVSELQQTDVRKDIGQRLISAHANLAMVYRKLEEDGKTSDHLKQAEKLFTVYGKPEDENVLLQSRAFEYVATGQFHKAVEMVDKGKDLCQRFGFEGHIPIYNHYLSFAHRYMGNFEAARVMAEEGLSMLLREGVKDNVYGTLQSDLGHCEMAEGKTQEGIQKLSESTGIFKKNQNFCGQFWNDCALSLLSAREGNLSLAWDYWRRMERNSRLLSLPMQHAMTLIIDAYLSAFEQSPDKTMEKLSKAKPLLERSRQKMSIFHGLVLAMKSYLTIERNDLAEEAYLSAASLGDFETCYYSYHYEADWFLPFAKRTIKKHPHLKPVANGSKSAPVRRNVANGLSEPFLSSEWNFLDLHIHAFGRFRIVINGWEVPLEQCQSKKALTLLKYLFFKRHEGGILLDEALELLWPEMDPRATRSNLRVILSMLRKVFKRPDNGSSGFPNLIRQGNKLSLSLGKRGWTDVDEFLDQVKLAGFKEKRSLWAEALNHYEKGFELYKGDFLYDELYADWCYMEREYLRDQFLTSLIRLAECQERVGDLSNAIGTLYHLLKTDRYREDAYLKLMELCASAGRKGEIIRIYGLCKKAIEEDLNLELSPTIKAACNRLINHASNGAAISKM